MYSMLSTNKVTQFAGAVERLGFADHQLGALGTIRACLEGCGVICATLAVRRVAVQGTSAFALLCLAV